MAFECLAGPNHLPSDNDILQESSHLIPTNVHNRFENSLSAGIITNLLEKRQTVSDSSIIFAFPSPELHHRKSRFHPRGISPYAFPCCHPACSRHEGQAECQHANAPPRQVPGRVVIDPSIAPRLPSQHWGQCRHHQDYLPASSHWRCSGACSRDRQRTNRKAFKMKSCCGSDPIPTSNAAVNQTASRPTSLRYAALRGFQH